jgi:multicomponent Na+:H+ antiporter subunit D
MTAISLFLIGGILKTAFFPMHFWMIRAYQSVSSVILIYIASITSIIGLYIILRFIHFVIDYQLIIETISNFIKPIALTTILLCSYFAFKGKNLRNIIIYSSASQIGYIFLLLAIPKGEILIFPFLYADSINKIALFLIVAYKETFSNQKSIDIVNSVEFDNRREERILDITRRATSNDVDNFKSINYSNRKPLLWRSLVAFNLICSCGLPISSMFVLKIIILELLLSQNMWLEFVIIIISSSLALLYHYKLAKIIFNINHSQIKHSNEPENSRVMLKNGNYYGLIFITIMQFILLIYLSSIQDFYRPILGGS